MRFRGAPALGRRVEIADLGRGHPPFIFSWDFPIHALLQFVFSSAFGSIYLSINLSVIHLSITYHLSINLIYM